MSSSVCACMYVCGRGCVYEELVGATLFAHAPIADVLACVRRLSPWLAARVLLCSARMPVRADPLLATLVAVSVLVLHALVHARIWCYNNNLLGLGVAGSLCLCSLRLQQF